MTLTKSIRHYVASKYRGDCLNRLGGFYFPHHFFMNKNLRFRLALEMFGNKELLKSVAMYLLIRKRLGSNVLKNYNINKLVSITGAHARTIKKRIRVLSQYGLVTIVGKTLILRSIVSKHAKRNVKLGERFMEYSTLKKVEYSLQAMLAKELQNKKDYAKRTIRNAHGASHDYKVVKAARDAARKFGYGFEYVENGLSYKTIAKKLGVCVKTAVKIIKFAEMRKILKKMTHFVSTYIPNCKPNLLSGLGYTFFTRNYGYKVAANTYSVAPSLALV